jgi:hypothetical protein
MGLDDDDSLTQWYMSLFIMQPAADFTETAVCCLESRSLFCLESVRTCCTISVVADQNSAPHKS